jgi:branched-chain amino acid transport system ATP-binding protein
MTAPLLSARSLFKRFGGIIAVHDVSISVAPLEVKCIIGANGAGKSSLFNILCGVYSADSGSVEFDGQNISGLPLHRFARIGIARKFQIPSVFSSLTVEKNLTVAIRERLSRTEINEKVADVLRLVELEALREQVAGDLAHGQKQWLEIAMALMAKPRLLLLDEPTAGMTPDETQRTANLIHQVSKETAVLAIEHDMSFVRALQSRTIVMHQGKIIVEGTFSDIEKNALVRDVYLGRA